MIGWFFYQIFVAFSFICEWKLYEKFLMRMYCLICKPRQVLEYSIFLSLRGPFSWGERCIKISVYQGLCVVWQKHVGGTEGPQCKEWLICPEELKRRVRKTSWKRWCFSQILKRALTTQFGFIPGLSNSHQWPKGWEEINK